MKLKSLKIKFVFTAILALSSNFFILAQTQIGTPLNGQNMSISKIDRNALPQRKSNQMSKKSSITDAHSYARPNEVAITHLDLNLAVSFDKKVVKGSATYTLRRTEGGTLMLDTRGLAIESVTDDLGAKLRFKLLEKDSIRGQALVVLLEESTTKVTINYATTSESAGLQWLTPAQNDGKTAFLYSQGQAILTRSWIPIQDSPNIRLTYNASITVPKGMIAVMSADGNVREKTEDQTTFKFKMTSPIPAYLIALAVGNLEFKALTETSGIYALPSVLNAAVTEFQEIDKMVVAAEKLCGPYEWKRFDVLVLPASFPFGGMENPMLTFATPTILAGDKSLVSLIIHELVHSWSGNLVTNSTWNDFWLNEGWTVYLERRIVEMMYGKETADMMQVLGFQELKATIADMPANDPDGALRLKLDNRDPDDGMTDVAYERGAMVIKNIEVAWGRQAFDPFITAYFKAHRFTSLTTDDFIQYTTKYAEANKLPIPDLAGMTVAVGEPKPQFKIFSERLMGMEKARVAFLIGKDLKEYGVATWTAQERQYFLRILKEKLTTEQILKLENSMKLKGSKNAEVSFEWYLLCIRNNHKAIQPEVQEFLSKVGRRKFVLPLYRAMLENSEWNAFASKIYQEFRSRYHSITSNSVDQLIKG